MIASGGKKQYGYLKADVKDIVDNLSACLRSNEFYKLCDYLHR